MKKSIFTLIALLLCATITEARTIQDFFISEPGNLFPLVSQSTRMDMVDYSNEGRLVEVKNALGDGTRFNKVTDNYVSVRTSSSSTVELLLLPISKKDSIIVAVSTVALPAKDSRIEFFTTGWGQYNTKSFIKEPTMKDFIVIPKGDKTKKETVLEAIDFPIISYSIDPENNKLIARHGLKEYMGKDAYEKIAPYLKDNIELNFKSGRFTSDKNKIDWTTVMISGTSSIVTSLILSLL